MTEWQDKILLEDVINKYANGQTYKKDLHQTDQYLSEKIKPGAEDLMGNSILTMRNKIKLFEELVKVELDQIKFNQERIENMNKLR